MHQTARILSWAIVACLMLLAAPAWADAPGKNGARTITAANTIVNQSTTLASAASAGATTITVAAIANLNSPEPTGGGPLAPGDVILLYQARGASIDTTNTPTYGNITSYGNAGNYELRTVAAVSGNNIGLEPAYTGTTCTAGLRNGYPAGSQVIRVPQYSSLTINAGASITSTAWNGSLGGIVALLVQGTMTVNGSITVDALGFRGGVVDATDRASGGAQTITFASDANPAGGQKGEGIASGAGGTFGGISLTFSNPGGNFEVGAPANGGGGGGSHNAGGGGGGNAAAALTPYCTTGTATYTIAAGTSFVWCGQGTMPNTDTGTGAWVFDPGYKANGNVRTAHVGGGRGGYSFSSANADATTATGAPGLAVWAGDNRRAVGGWGGRPLQQTLDSRLFFGGGGGAGANNNGTGGSGGAGGGIIIFEAGTLAGSGLISANGANGASTTGSGNDAPGGGGAGGTIVARAGSGSVGTLRANGGNGGNQLISGFGNEAEGPGGGGGGGIIAQAGFTAITQQANGGLGGTTNSPGLTEFPRNGATDGSAGLTGQTPPNIQVAARTCTNLSITKSNSVGTVTAGGTTAYTVTVVNAGPGGAGGTLLRDPVATGLNCTAVSCTSAAGGAVCPTAASTTMAYLQGSGVTLPSLPASSTLRFSISCAITATGSY